MAKGKTACSVHGRHSSYCSHVTLACKVLSCYLSLQNNWFLPIPWETSIFLLVQAQIVHVEHVSNRLNSALQTCQCGHCVGRMAPLKALLISKSMYVGLVPRIYWLVCWPRPPGRHRKRWMLVATTRGAARREGAGHAAFATSARGLLHFCFHLTDDVCYGGIWLQPWGFVSRLRLRSAHLAIAAWSMKFSKTLSFDHPVLSSAVWTV